MTAPVSVSCSKQTKSLTQTGLRSISGIGTDRRASRNERSHCLDCRLLGSHRPETGRGSTLARPAKVSAYGANPPTASVRRMPPSKQPSSLDQPLLDRLLDPSSLDPQYYDPHYDARWVDR